MPSQTLWPRPLKAARGVDHLDALAIPVTLYDNLPAREPGWLPTMTTHADSNDSATNQERLRERLRERLKPEALARRLADAFDVKQTPEANNKALEQAINDELDKARRSLEQDEDQVG